MIPGGRYEKKEIAALQEAYRKLALFQCENMRAIYLLLEPFRQKYNLTVDQVLRIAKKEATKEEIRELCSLSA